MKVRVSADGFSLRAGPLRAACRRFGFSFENDWIAALVRWVRGRCEKPPSVESKRPQISATNPESSGFCVQRPAARSAHVRQSSRTRRL